MSQILIQKQEQKLWQILDDCIKTNKYTQVIGTLGVKNKACALGVLGAYGGGGDDDEGRFNVICNDSRFNNTSFIEIGRHKDKEYLINKLKSGYKQSGQLNAHCITLLNDFNNTTFSEFRDIFREMGV